MRLQKKIICLWVALLAASFFSCSKKAETRSLSQGNAGDSSLGFLDYSVAGGASLVTISYPDIVVQFPDSVTNPGALVASFNLPAGEQLSSAGIKQISGSTPNNFDLSFFYTVKDQYGDSSEWEVTGTNNNYTIPWGLGQWLQLSKSNNRDYDWYIDQGSTGGCSLSNCGPACATMAMRWSDSTFTKTTVDARHYFNDSCADWDDALITTYLQTGNIPYALVPSGDSAEQMRDLFKAQLDSGRIIIISLFMGSIPFSSGGQDLREDQFLPGAGDHYIILKGYRQTESGFYFECYDPWDFGNVYTDGTPKGENRFYPYQNVYIAILSDGGGTQVAVSKKQ